MLQHFVLHIFPAHRDIICERAGSMSAVELCPRGMVRGRGRAINKLAALGRTSLRRARRSPPRPSPPGSGTTLNRLTEPLTHSGQDTAEGIRR